MLMTSNQDTGFFAGLPVYIASISAGNSLVSVTAEQLVSALQLLFLLLKGRACVIDSSNFLGFILLSLTSCIQGVAGGSALAGMDLMYLSLPVLHPSETYSEFEP